jgi:hypothetical protein
MDRPYVAREVLPSGSAPSVNLLEALDHRMQEGTFEPSSLAPYARLTSVGTVVLRSDLEYERFNTPRPRALWAQLTQPLAPGLAAPRAFGSTKPNRPTKRLPMIDNVELRIPTNAANPPAVAAFDVNGAVPIVHTAPSEQPVLMAGDGDGIVDAAAAGLLDGNQLVLQSAALDDRALAQALHANADLVLTDSNRRRSQHYFSRIRDASGYTERAGQTAPHDDDHFRLEPFPGSTDASRTVVEQHGAQVGATDYAVNADRPAYAFDGNPFTAWRVGSNAVGARLTVHPDQPVRTDHITLAQLPDAARSIGAVRLHFDGGDTLDVTLDPTSRAPQGQTVTFPERTIRDLAIEITKVDVPQYDPDPRIVGFTEVGLGDVTVRETVRLPTDFARAGARTAGHRLDVVLSRLRYDPGQLQDEELALDRRFVLPTARSFALSGTARVNPNARDEVLDQLLGTTAPGTTFESSDHLAGDLDARASRAFDHDPSTAWTPNFGPQEGRFVGVSLPAPTMVNSVDLTMVNDRHHSVPTQFSLQADGVTVRSFTVPPIGDVSQDGATRTITIPFDPVVARDLRLVVDAVTPRFTTVALGHPKVELPVSIAEIGFAGVPTPAQPSPIATACRDDLVIVNGDHIPVRVVGAVADARRGLTLESCVDSLSLDRGSNTVGSAEGIFTGLDIDRVVLSSGTAGTAEAATVLGAPLHDAGASVRVVDSGPDSYDLKVRTDGRPFWLVLGESANSGWEANASRGRVGARQQVNGFANGWLVTPGHAGTLTMTLRWTPQRAVWVGIAVSILVVILCIALIVLAWRRRRGARDESSLSDEPSQWSPFAFPGAPLSRKQELVFAVAAAVTTALFSRIWIGIAVGVVVLGAARISRGRIVLTAGAPVALAFGRMTRFDDLAWLALALLAADAVMWWLRTRRDDGERVASA